MKIKTEELTRGGKVTGTITTFKHNGLSIELSTCGDEANAILSEIVRRCDSYDYMRQQLDAYEADDYNRQMSE